jgi:CBS domain-containing protein
MVTAREIMHTNIQSVRSDETLTAAATKMRDLHVGALPVVGGDNQLQGLITDRDIVVRGLAEGHSAESTTAAALIREAPISVAADADVGDVLYALEQNKVRRVMVVDGQRVVGIISESNLATHLDPSRVGEFAASVYSAPPNN